MVNASCRCGDTECMFQYGYPYCRLCGRHHRFPECAMNEQGEPLAECGCTWASLDKDGHAGEGCLYSRED